MRGALNKFLLSLVVGICYVTSVESRLIGGCKDEHGCYTCAGYTWCEGVKECVQRWTSNCILESKNA